MRQTHQPSDQTPQFTPPFHCSPAIKQHTRAKAEYSSPPSTCWLHSHLQCTPKVSSNHNSKELRDTTPNHSPMREQQRRASNSSFPCGSPLICSTILHPFSRLCAPSNQGHIVPRRRAAEGRSRQPSVSSVMQASRWPFLFVFVTKTIKKTQHNTRT